MDRITREQAKAAAAVISYGTFCNPERTEALQCLVEFAQQQQPESDAEVRKEIFGLLAAYDIKTKQSWWIRECCNGRYGLIYRDSVTSAFVADDSANFTLIEILDNLRELTKPPVQEFAVDDFVTVDSGGPAWIHGARLESGIWKYQLRHGTGNLGSGFCWEAKELTHRDPEPPVPTHSGATDAMAGIFLDQKHGRVPAKKDIMIVDDYLDHISDKDVD